MPRQTSESDTPPRVPSCSVIGLALAGLPRFSDRNDSSIFSCCWRAMISSRVCAPPVAVRSTSGALCAHTGLKSSVAIASRAAPNSVVFIRVLQRNGPKEDVAAISSGALGPRNCPVGLRALLLVSCAPSPGAGTETAVHHTLAIDVRNRVAITGQQGFG